MWQTDEYELLDFGEGRKLERLGGVIVDRPAPAAESCRKKSPRLWSQATARFVRESASKSLWVPEDAFPHPWLVRHEGIRLELAATPFGHVGLFPEQAENWNWLAREIKKCHFPVRLLNLFSYTGASSLTAAAAGARVAHVDASRSAVQWARRNATHSGLEEHPIRWLVEDVSKFVEREVRRENQYDAVILDPPSYGHGPRGEVWKIRDHLEPLLEACAKLTAGRLQFCLMTCHTPTWEATDLLQLVESYFPEVTRRQCESGSLEIATSRGDRLPSGSMVRWSRHATAGGT